MQVRPNVERLLYALIVALSLAILMAVLCSSGAFTDVKVVYEAF